MSELNPEELKYYLKRNVELTKELENYNYKLSGLVYMSVLVVVILIVILIKVMGWV